jgi:lysyl-tRNA synthetase class 2
VTADVSLRASLHARAETLAAIRQFFADRGVVEVETPVLSRSAPTDPSLASLHCRLESLAGRLYLQTSPEHAMKRLLAAGSGDIFQIARVYRDGEIGRWHQPEFSLLEWYRLGFDEVDLMDEVHALLELVLSPRIPALPRLNLSYGQAFESTFGVDALDLNVENRDRLAAAVTKRGVHVPDDIEGDELLDLALAGVIATDWPRDTAIYLHAYPASQAALAAIDAHDPRVARRFEVFVNGLEIGNGYRELTDPRELERRLRADLATRRRNGLAEPPPDTDLIRALEAGLPECAGIAIGLDRLIALRIGANSLAEVVNFPHE